MTTAKKKYSEEYSQKTIAMMKMFIGKSLGGFPIPCLTKWIGGTMIEVERGLIIIEVTVTTEMTNPGGAFHGGMQCALLDDAMGWACATLGYETQFLSTNLTVDYLGTARVGDTVRVKSTIYREGSSLLHAVGEITKDDKVIAKAQSNIYITTRPIKLNEPAEQ